MKNKFDSDNEFSLNKTLEIPKMTIAVWYFFYGNNKYDPQV